MPNWAHTDGCTCSLIQDLMTPCHIDDTELHKVFPREENGHGVLLVVWEFLCMAVVSQVAGKKCMPGCDHPKKLATRRKKKFNHRV